MLEFRSIDLSDAAGKEAAVRFRRDSFVCSFGDDARFDERHYLTWLEAKLARDPGLALHAFEGNRLVGQLELGTFTPIPSIGYVNLYYLVPSRRGAGLGAELDGHAMQALHARGFGTARLSVSPSNGRARRFLTRHGWKELGPRPEVPDVISLEKELYAPSARSPAVGTEPP
ncbi:MAG: GNAT family N-acetyltransferase [Polyangiaceae bacterium]|jgi:GNAT superfamily N-acetyltransferase